MSTWPWYQLGYFSVSLKSVISTAPVSMNGWQAGRLNSGRGDEREGEEGSTHLQHSAHFIVNASHVVHHKVVKPNAHVVL